MSDEEGDVHVCEVCQEILLGTHDLEEHMKDAHTSEAKNEDNESTNGSDDSGFIEKKRSRSPKEKGEDGRKELKKHKTKQHKHRDRSRSWERDRSSKKESRKNEHIDDGEDLARVKMKKFLSKHNSWDAEKGTVGVAKKAWASEGVVQEHANLDGPQCPKCDQICKDIANLRNHILSHYYSDFYRVTPDTRPFPCPTCGKENRDRITMIRHFAFSHNMLFELTDVTPEMLNPSGRESRGSRQMSNSLRRGEDEKQKKDEDLKFKHRMARNPSGNDKKSSEISKSSRKDSREHKKHRNERHREGGKHRDEKKHKREERGDNEKKEKHGEHKGEKDREHTRKKYKDHKRERGERSQKDKVHSVYNREEKGRREETVEERRIRKEKKRIEKERKPNIESKAAYNISNEPHRDLVSPRTNQDQKQSTSSSGEQDTYKAVLTVEASSDEEDFGDLPTPVFAE